MMTRTGAALCGHSPGEYVSSLMERMETESARQIAALIPPEIGSIEIQEKRVGREMVFSDWRMNYKTTLDVKNRKREGGEEVQLIFFLNRGMEWKIGEAGRRVSVDAGEACIYRDGCLTTAARYPAGVDYIFKSLEIPVAFFGHILEEYFSEQEQKKVERILRSVTKMAITPYMYRLLGEVEDSGRYCGGTQALYLEGKIQELLAVCLHGGMEEGGDAFLGCASISRTDKAAILEVKRRIDLLGGGLAAGGTSGRFLTEISIPSSLQLAREAGLSASKLAKGFTKVVGMPIHAYVIERRLEYAACLLAGSCCNVSQAAVMAGYSNMSHFSAAFRKRYGLSPKEYGKSGMPGKC